MGKKTGRHRPRAAKRRNDRHRPEPLITNPKTVQIVNRLRAALREGPRR